MEDRHILAYTLGATLVLIVAFVVVRYLNNRRQFKIRQSGRGKSVPGAPAE